jgi:membrane protease YdiL (CAAX protease family)
MPKRTLFPSVPQAALLLLAGFLLQYVFITALYDLRWLLGLTREQLATIGTLLSNGVLIAVVMHILGIGHKDLLHPSNSSPTATFLFLVPPILLLLPLIVLMDIALNWALEAIFPVSSWEHAAFASMVEPTLPAFVATCLVAPFAEEMLFRGILLRSFLQRHPRGAAISYSALYFGAAHLNVYQFFLAFLLGLLLGWLYERSRSLIPCIALHAAVNLTVFVWSTAQDAATVHSLSDIPALAWPAAVAAAAVGAFILHRLLSRRENAGANAASA